jgi:deoxyribodipyrimidine photo-lyase
MSRGKVLIYLLRRDLRVFDNPILHHLADLHDHGFTHVLPIFVIPPHQIEVAGFLKDGEKSPYPEARSQVGKFWRCGPHRARFLAQSLWDLKRSLEELHSGLVIRAGSFPDVLRHTLKGFQDTAESVSAVWMTEELSHEEIQDQESIAKVCTEEGIAFKLWPDEKYFIDE